MPTVAVSDEARERTARLCMELGTDGLRGELTLIRAARALACLDGADRVQRRSSPARRADGVAPSVAPQSARRSRLDRADRACRGRPVRRMSTPSRRPHAMMRRWRHVCSRLIRLRWADWLFGRRRARRATGSSPHSVHCRVRTVRSGKFHPRSMTTDCSAAARSGRDPALRAPGAGARPAGGGGWRRDPHSDGRAHPGVAGRKARRALDGGCVAIEREGLTQRVLNAGRPDPPRRRDRRRSRAVRAARSCRIARADRSIIRLPAPNAVPSRTVCGRPRAGCPPTSSSKTA